MPVVIWFWWRWWWFSEIVYTVGYIDRYSILQRLVERRQRSHPTIHPKAELECDLLITATLWTLSVKWKSLTTTLARPLRPRKQHPLPNTARLFSFCFNMSTSHNVLAASPSIMPRPTYCLARVVPVAFYTLSVGLLLLFFFLFNRNHRDDRVARYDGTDNHSGRILTFLFNQVFPPFPFLSPCLFYFHFQKG